MSKRRRSSPRALELIYKAVVDLRDDDERLRSEVFMTLPERAQEPPRPEDFPQPTASLPKGLGAGTTDKLVNGALPSMRSKLPTEDELRTWTQASQEAFWEQRRTFYNKKKVSELQRECRRHSIWPGGEQTYLKDRLMRFDCCPSRLKECELQTEDDVAGNDDDIGVIYYKLVENPIDLTTIKKKVDADQYADIAALEADLLLLFDNARTFDEATTPAGERFVSEDADAMQAAMEVAIEKNGGEPSTSTARPGKKSKPTPASKSKSKSKAKPKKAAPKPKAKPKAKPKPKPKAAAEALSAAELHKRCMRVWDEVAGVMDGERPRSEVFMDLPKKPSARPTAGDFPQPLTGPPEKLASGTSDKLVNGALPSMRSKLPTEDELGTWTEASQVAFWEQRRAFYNRMKLSELQRECRRKSIWPGGDMPFVKDRLMRFDCCPSRLKDCELKTEEDFADDEIGSLYYEVIENPIDLAQIKSRIQAEEYSDAEAFHSDLLLLFANARKFDETTNVPDERWVTDDANALEEAMYKVMGPELGIKKVTPGAAAEHAAALAAIKTVPLTPRQKLKSDFAEKMHTVWDVIQSVGDGYGRRRAKAFMSLPSKRKKPEYYEAIEDPIHLGHIRQKIVSGAYKNADEFEEDMTKVFENARAYYGRDEREYNDAEVLQTAFWECFATIEQGLSFELKETPGEWNPDDAEDSDGFSDYEEEDGGSDDEDEDDLSDWEEKPAKKRKSTAKKGKPKLKSFARSADGTSEEEDDALDMDLADELDDTEEVEIAIPSPSVEQRTLGDLLAVYAQLRMFFNMPGLVISIFTLEDLMAALVSTQENRLLSEIHLCLLRYVKYNDINDGVTTGRFGKQTDMELLPWLVMHGLTWPETVKTYAEEREAAGGEVLREFKSDEWGERPELVDMYLPNLARRVVDHLSGTEYWALPPAAKVEILRFLCEVLLNTGAFHDELLHRALKLSGERRKGLSRSDVAEHVFEYEFCSICGQDGEMVLCDGCPCAFHLHCLNLSALPDGDWYCGSCHHEELEAAAVNIKPFGRDSNGNRYWFTGGHIFAEDVVSGEFRHVKDGEINEWTSRRAGGTAVERNLARRMRGLLPKLNKRRLDTRLVNRFTTVQHPLEPSEVSSSDRPYAGMYSGASYSNRIEGMGFKPDVRTPPNDESVGHIFNKFVVRECTWPNLRNDALSTVFNLAGRLQLIEEKIPSAFKHSTWAKERVLWLQQLEQAATREELAAAVLKLEAALTSDCFGAFWRDQSMIKLKQAKEDALRKQIFPPYHNSDRPADFFTSFVYKAKEQEEDVFTFTRSGRRSVKTTEPPLDELAASPPDISERAMAADRRARISIEPLKSKAVVSSTFNPWNTAWRDYEGGELMFHGYRVRIVHCTPPLFAIADVVKLVTGAEREPTNQFVGNPPMTHAFEGNGARTGTVAQSNATKVEALPRFQRFLERCKVIRAGKYRAEVEEFENSGRAHEFMDAAEARNRHKRIKPHIGWLRHPRPKGRNLKGKVWNYFSGIWHAEDPAEPAMMEYYLVPEPEETEETEAQSAPAAGDSSAPEQSSATAEPTSDPQTNAPMDVDQAEVSEEDRKLRQILTAWDPDTDVLIPDDDPAKAKDMAYLWSVLEAQEGWDKQTEHNIRTKGAKIGSAVDTVTTYYLPKGVTRSRMGSMVGRDYFDNVNGVLRHLRGIEWRGWKAPKQKKQRVGEPQLIKFYNTKNVSEVVDQVSAYQLAQKAAESKKVQKAVRRYINKFNMGQATVGQKAGVSQCDVSNWIRGNYMGYRNDHISAKFKEFLMGENFPLEASPDETEDLQERRGRNSVVVAPTNEAMKEPAKPAEPAEPKADAAKPPAGSGKPAAQRFDPKLRPHEIYLGDKDVSESLQGDQANEFTLGVAAAEDARHFSLVSHYRACNRRKEKRVEPELIQQYGYSTPTSLDFAADRALGTSDGGTVEEPTAAFWNQKPWLKPGALQEDAEVASRTLDAAQAAERELARQKEERAREAERDVREKLFGRTHMDLRADVSMVRYFEETTFLSVEPRLVDFYFQVWTQKPKLVRLGTRVRMRFPETGRKWYEGAATRVFSRRKKVNVKFDDIDRLGIEVSWHDRNIEFYQEQPEAQLGRKKHRRSVVHLKPTNLFNARSNADREYYKEHYDWTFTRANIPGDEPRFTIPPSQRPMLRRAARRGGVKKLDGYAGYDGERRPPGRPTEFSAQFGGQRAFPVKNTGQMWRENMQQASQTSIAAVALHLTVLECGLNAPAMQPLIQACNHTQVDEARQQRKREGVVRSVLDTLIRTIDREERVKGRPGGQGRNPNHPDNRRFKYVVDPQTGKRVRQYADAHSGPTHVMMDYADLSEGMSVELYWQDDQEWYQAVVKEVSDTDVLLHYPKTDEDERIERVDIKPNMLRRTVHAPTWQQRGGMGDGEDDAGMEDPGLAALKKMPDEKPRAPLDSAVHERMHKVWDALAEAGDGYYRSRAKPFMKLPNRNANPDYYEQIQRPIHLETIRKKIVNGRYVDMDAFEEDMTLLLENNRAYYEKDSSNYKDIEILQNIFWEAFQAYETGQEYKMAETPGVFKRPQRRQRAASFSLASVSTDVSEKRELRKVPTETEQIERVLNEVCEAEHRGFPAVERFERLPKRVEEIKKTPSFPEPTTEPPDVTAGTTDVLTGGKLPKMAAKGLPSEAELRTWTLASQHAFWTQRRAHWNKMKLNDLQRECRKRDIWPGGDAPFVKERLLRYDFIRSELLPCETRTEAQEKEELIGAQYYEVIRNPIDIATMRKKIADSEYSSFADFEKDMELMLKNAVKYNDAVQEEAFPNIDVLRGVLATALRTLRAEQKKLENYNKLAERHNKKLDRKQEIAALGPQPRIEDLEHGITWKEFGAKYAPWYSGPNARAIHELWKQYREMPGRSDKTKGPKAAAVDLPKLNLPPLKAQLLRIFDTVCGVKDGDRLRADLFMKLPPKSEPLEPFPDPIAEPPSDFPTGIIDKTAEPPESLQQMQPSEDELKSWTRASQVSFWEQRRVVFGRMKLTELQRACRTRGIYPGGALHHLRDRLMRFDFCKSRLIAREKWTEAEHAAVEQDIGLIYYSLIKRPIDMSMIRAKIDSDGYENMGGMEKDMQRLFENARKFDASVNPENEREVSADADALEAAMKQTVKDTTELLKKMKQAHKEKVTSARGEADPGARVPSGAEAEAVLKPRLTFKEQLTNVFEAVWDAKDGRRQRCEPFIRLPEKQERAPPLPQYPAPREFPAEGELVCGTVDKLVDGVLPNMSQQIPEEEDCRTWTRASQLAYWEQRKAYWNRFKQRDLQRECRNRSIWPGGENPHLKDRLLCYDFAFSQLRDWEARSEEETAQVDQEGGFLYHDVVPEPIDLATIRARIDADEYKGTSSQSPDDVAIGLNGGLAQLVKDLKLLFDNARTFEAEAFGPQDRLLTRDANALEKVMKKAVDDVKAELRKVHRYNENALKPPDPSRKRARSSGGSRKRLKMAPAMSEQMARVFDAVISTRDGNRLRAELFMTLPERSEPLEPFPAPLAGPPTDIPAGDVEIKTSMNGLNPSEKEVGTWTRDTQALFWKQRKKLFSTMKLTELQAALRKRKVFPGSHRHFLIDRLLRCDFCKSRLTKRELMTEEEHEAKENDIGAVYYEIVKDPIDLTMIRQKLEGDEYGDMSELEADLNKLYANARLFATKAGPGPRFVADVDALQSSTKRALKEMSALLKGVVKHNEAVALASSGDGPVDDPDDSEDDADGVHLYYMDDAWEAVRHAIIGGRKLADAFMTLPAIEEYPSYYQHIEKPMDLATVRERIDEQKYRRWDQFERDILLVFTNALEFNAEGSPLWDDARALQQVFMAQRTPDGFRQPPPTAKRQRPSGGARRAAAKKARASATQRKPMTVKEQMARVLDAVINTKDGDRLQAEFFMTLPEETEQYHLENPFPTPLAGPPTDVPVGGVEITKSMNSLNPSEEEVGTWTRDTQARFWEQRRSKFNNMKLTELQRLCRKRDVYPGGDKRFIVDRLLRRDFCQSRLTARERLTEEEHEAKENDAIYYDIVKDPIDLAMIRRKLEGGEYGGMGDLEADLNKLFANARLFADKAGTDDSFTDDVNALQSALIKAMKELKDAEKNNDEGDEPDIDGASPGQVVTTLGWTPEEDAALLIVVKQDGPGDWGTKSAQFPYERSATALRKRWAKLDAQGIHNTKQVAGGPTPDSARPASGPGSKRMASQEPPNSPPPVAKPAPAAKAPAPIKVPQPKAAPMSKEPPQLQQNQMGAWSAEEDAALIKVVKKEGVGHWADKAAHFPFERSETSLRKRWIKIGDKVTAAADEAKTAPKAKSAPKAAKSAPKAAPKSAPKAAKAAPATSSASAAPALSKTDRMREALKAVRDATDADGRVLSELFEELPSAEDYPDYFELIKTPIDLETCATLHPNCLPVCS